MICQSKTAETDGMKGKTYAAAARLENPRIANAPPQVSAKLRRRLDPHRERASVVAAGRVPHLVRGMAPATSVPRRFSYVSLSARRVPNHFTFPSLTVVCNACRTYALIYIKPNEPTGAESSAHRNI